MEAAVVVRRRGSGEPEDRSTRASLHDGEERGGKEERGGSKRKHEKENNGRSVTEDVKEGTDKESLNVKAPCVTLIRIL